MKILVIQLKRIGDLILTSPVLSVLQSHFPDAEIDLVVEQASAGILPAFPAHRARIFRRGSLNITTLLAIGRETYDICLDLNGSDRSLLISSLSGAKRKIVYQKYSKKIFRKVVYTDWVDSPVRKRHTVDHFLDILRPLGVSVENERPSLNISEKEKQQATQALQSAGISGPFAVIHPGTARVEKLWPADRWAEVVKWLQQNQSLQTVITGVQNDMDTAGIKDILAATGNSCVSLVGKLSLLGTAAVIQQAKLLCSVDSAPVHLAEALNTPVVALYGPMNPFVWMPRHTACRIAHPSVRDGKFAWDTPGGEMGDISVELVIQDIREIL
ncbi:MAG: glycosyltransferase family 9 protein [Chthoniobacterales bacterium]